MGSQGIILVSSDGVTWMDGDSRVLRRDARLNDIVYGDAGFVAVGGAWDNWSVTYEDLGPMEEGYMPVVTSLDGLKWTAQKSGISLNTLNAVAYGDNTYVIVGKNGLILTSPDGAHWTLRPSGTELDINVLVYGNNTFVAVGSGRIALTSHDGINWTKIISENINIPTDITYGAGCPFGKPAMTERAPVCYSCDHFTQPRRMIDDHTGNSFPNKCLNACSSSIKVCRLAEEEEEQQICYSRRTMVSSSTALHGKLSA